MNKKLGRIINTSFSVLVAKTRVLNVSLSVFFSFEMDGNN